MNVENNASAAAAAPAAAVSTPAAPQKAEPRKGDHGLHDDVRLLGRLLGETVREHEGDEAFERIETIRRLSVAASRHKASEERPAAKNGRSLRGARGDGSWRLRGRPQARSIAAQPLGQGGADGHSRLQLFFASRQYRRGSASFAAAGAGRGRRRKDEPDRAQPQPHVRPFAQGVRGRRQDRPGSRARVGLSRAHRASDRG